jgi:hypothetical protein
VLAREGIVTDAEIELTAPRKVTGADWAAQAPQLVRAANFFWS